MALKKSYIIILLLLITTLNAIAQISNDATMSLITVSPSDEEVYTLYGHTSLRVKDSVNNIDLAFNYGIFDFSKPNFIYRFTKGETDYRLEAYPFKYFISEYEMRGGEVTEQILDLTFVEKKAIWEALITNLQPQNKVYRYNFFFDNCATRPLNIIENGIEGKLVFPNKQKDKSFRDIINHSTRNHPWLTFGCDLALGSPTDSIINGRDEMFLPKYLMDGLDKATIIADDGTSRPLVSSTKKLTTGIEEEVSGAWNWMTPNVACWTLFIIVLACTIYQWRKKKYNPIIDCALFLAAGIGGIVLWFLCFISTHPCISPNWNIIWIQPFDLIAAILFIVKRLRKAAFFYHFINFALLTVLLLGWSFIPQHLNTAFIPLVMSIWLRSGYTVYRNYGA